MGNDKYHIAELDLLKGISIFTVILEHSFSVKYINLLDVGWCVQTIEFIKGFNMQTFFIVSGFLFANSTTTDLKRQYCGKIDRLLVPYVVFSALVVASKFIFSDLVNRNAGGGYSVLYGVFIAGGGETYWFVYLLFIIFLVAIPLKKYLYNGWILLLSILSLILIHETGIVQTDIFSLRGAIHYGVFFLIGFALQQRYNELREKIASPINVSIMIAGYVVLFYFFRYNICIATWFMPSIMTFGLLGLCATIKKGRVLEYLGKYSLQFYLFNGFALVLSRLLWAKMVHSPLILVSLVCLTCIFVISVFVEISRRIPVINYLCGYGRIKPSRPVGNIAAR